MTSDEGYVVLESSGCARYTKDDVLKLIQEMSARDSGGAVYAKTYMKEKLIEWSSQPLNIALIGSSGVGKSTFVNTICGFAKGNSEQRAPVGLENKVAHPPTGYTDPLNSQVMFWELPGVGTAEYPKDDTYLSKAQIERYDFFLIFSGVRFLEDDVWLAKHIQKTGKKFFFIRGKIDIDIKSEQEDNPGSFNEENTLADIRQSTVSELDRSGFPNSKVFLICNKQQSKWDFPLLCKTLNSDSNVLKEEAIALSLRAVSKEIVHEKLRALKLRMNWTAGCSALASIIPIPGVSFAADVGLIWSEYLHYKKQLHLDTDSLNSLSEVLSADQRSKLEELRREKIMTIDSYDAVLVFIKGCSRLGLVEEASRLVVGFGTFIASGISYATTLAILTSILEKLSENAYRVFEIIASDS